MTIPPLPPLLKKSEWQKHASIVAKVMPGKSSGLGDALGKLETAYKAFSDEAAKFDPKKAIAEADTWNGGKLAALADGVQSSAGGVKHQATTSATAWKAKLCPVPKSTREYAEKIATTAETLTTVIFKLRTNWERK